MRYPCEIRKVIVSFFLTKYKSLSHPSSWFGILKGFLDCLHNAAVTKLLRHKIFGFENGRNGLLFREERPRVTQEWRWVAENYSGIRSKDSPSESSFCFICAPDTTIADWLDCFIPIPKADAGGDLIIWKNSRLRKALIKGHCCVIADIDSPLPKFAKGRAPSRMRSDLRAICVLTSVEKLESHVSQKKFINFSNK
jgi:hypothetical protein